LAEGLIKTVGWPDVARGSPFAHPWYKSLHAGVRPGLEVYKAGFTGVRVYRCKGLQV